MNVPSTTLAISTVVGGYRVAYGDAIHLVDKSKRCSCGHPKCPAVQAVADYLRAGGRRAPERVDPTPRSFACPVCGQAAHGCLETRNWRCSADDGHLWAWWAEQIKAKRAAWEPSPYTREVLATFGSNEARQAWLQEHALKYPAGA